MNSLRLSSADLAGPSPVPWVGQMIAVERTVVAAIGDRRDDGARLGGAAFDTLPGSRRR